MSASGVSDDRAGGQALSPRDRQRRIEAGDQPALEDVPEVRVVGQRRPDELVRSGIEPQFAGPEGLALVDEGPARVAVHHHEGRHADIGLRPFGDGRRLSQRGPPLPKLGDAPITRRGKGIGAVIGDDQEIILIDPADIALGRRKGEAALDELSGGDVELAHHVGVGAARAQRNEAARIIGREAVGAVPDPAFALFLPQRIDVDQHPPFGFAGGIGFERRDPPQSARILRVAPEIGDLVPEHVLGRRDLLLVVEDRLGPRAIFFITGHRGEDRLGLGIPFLHLRQRPLALYLLQPKIGIVGHGRRGGGSKEQGGDRKDRSEQGTSPNFSVWRKARG